jgi:hypothetical protein
VDSQLLRAHSVDLATADQAPSRLAPPRMVHAHRRIASALLLSGALVVALAGCNAATLGAEMRGGEGPESGLIAAKRCSKVADNVSQLRDALDDARPAQTVCMKAKRWRDVDIVFRGQGTSESRPRWRPRPRARPSESTASI